jgi:hypothetical protein
VIRADGTLNELIEEIDRVREEDRQTFRPPSVVLKKLACALDEFATYIDNTARAIVNCGERYRRWERISIGFAESRPSAELTRRAPSDVHPPN